MTSRFSYVLGHLSEASLSWLRTVRDLFQTKTFRDAFLQQIAVELRIPVHQLDCTSGFIRNGGDSLSAIKIASSCRSNGLDITVSELMSCESVNNLIRDLDHHHGTRSFPYVSENFDIGGKRSISSPSPLTTTSAKEHIDVDGCHATDTQLSLIHGSKTLAGRNIIQYHETYRTENVPQVRDAWRAVVASEPIFRTCFRPLQDKYCLVEESDAVFTWDEVVARDEEEAKSYLADLNFNTDFIGASFRVVHLETEDRYKESTVIWNIHHALIDGYSSMLILNKHRELLSGHTIESGLSFVRLIGQVAKFRDLWEPGGQDFWIRQQKRLQAARSELHLPSPEIPFNPFYARNDVSLDVDWKILHQYAKETGVTVATIFYAAWALTLSHYVDSSAVCFGVVLSGRSLPLEHAANVVGPLINILPFQISVVPEQPASSYLRSVLKHSVDLDRYQWTIPGHGVAKTFPSTLNVHFETSILRGNPLGLLRKPHSSILSALPLNVNIHMDGDIQLFYHEHIFCSGDIKRLGEMFATAITTLLDANRSIRQCSKVLISRYREQLWENGNCYSLSTFKSRPTWNENLVVLFEHTAMVNPETIAVEQGKNAITYSQLNLISTRLAHKLIHQIFPEEVICVHADRSINWLILIYGILKAGGVYCPLDAALPNLVRDQIFSQSDSRIFLTGGSSAKIFKPSACTICISAEELLADTNVTFDSSEATHHEPAPILTSDSDAGAYLCFTSGSTGTPKGILCSHRGLVSFQKDFDVRLRSQPGWRIAQVMSPAFDGSIHEIFSALSYGSTLVLRDSSDPFEHLHGVDATILTPSIAQALDPGDFPSLKVLYLVGEAVSQEVSNKWASKLTLYNMYGPTEATCGATIKLLQPHKLVTLGRPNPSTRIYVLDSQKRLVPPGVIGEIYLAGVQVSHGYACNPEETAKSFLLDSIRSGPEERMYRTGDRGYWDDEGDLRFRGRNDRQIKLKGFRIDLDDIEVRIQNAIPECTAVAVVCDDRHKYLVAQIQPKHIRTHNLKEKLSQVLPIYSIPRSIMAVAHFPQTSAGKLDYKFIMQSASANGPLKSSLTSIACEDRLLVRVADVWRGVLRLPQDTCLDPESSFFELGGDSLLQLQLATKLSQSLGYSVPLFSIVTSPTLGDLVEKLTRMTPVNGSLARIATNVTSVAPIEEDWWRRNKYDSGSASFNVAALFELGQSIDLARLLNAWNEVLDRHHILRCRFTEANDGTLQRVFSKMSPRVQEMGQIDVAAETSRIFDLEHDHLIRVLLTPTKLLIITSHIICDYSSLKTMLYEVSCYYLGIGLQKAKRYCDYLQMTTPPTAQDLVFWRTYLERLPKPNYSIGKWSLRTSHSGLSRVCRISTKIFHKLRRFASSQRMTAHQVSLAAVSLALQHHSNETDIVLGAPHLGRTRNGAEDVVGLFLEPLPIRIRYPLYKAPNIDFLRSVQESSQNALCHALPWHTLLKTICIAPRIPDPPLFDAMVSYHDDFGKMGMAGIDAKPIYVWTEGSKFKLMVEFIVANDDALLMRLEYSDQCFDQASIAVVQRLVVAALEMIIDGLSYEVIKKSLQESYLKEEDTKATNFDTSVFFGILFSKI